MKPCSDSHTAVCFVFIIVTAMQYSCSYWNTLFEFHRHFFLEFPQCWCGFCTAPLSVFSVIKFSASFHHTTLVILLHYFKSGSDIS